MKSTNCFKRNMLAFAAGLGLLALTPALAADPLAPPPATYVFGALSQRSALLTAQFWNPILEHVSRHSGVNLVLKATRSAPESTDATEKGEYDFVYSNNIFQPKMARADYQVILRPRDEAIAGQIVTLADSPIQTLSEMNGKEMGFPSLAAFIAYAVPMDYLRRQGIGVTPVFGANQEGIMTQLKAGKVLAAAVNSQIMRGFASRENLDYRVLWESERFLNIPIAAHPRVPKTVVAKVRDAFDKMDGSAEGLKTLEASGQIIGQKPPYGFRAATPADYRSYRDFYRNAVDNK
ncbi:MAG: phosphate/phosphite/phosphonate ABC transporter substrate-binding protein [Rhodocyclaceae bacterium]